MSAIPPGARQQHLIIQFQLRVRSGSDDLTSAADDHQHHQLERVLPRLRVTQQIPDGQLAVIEPGDDRRRVRPVEDDDVPFRSTASAPFHQFIAHRPGERVVLLQHLFDVLPEDRGEYARKHLPGDELGGDVDRVDLHGIHQRAVGVGALPHAQIYIGVGAEHLLGEREVGQVVRGGGDEPGDVVQVGQRIALTDVLHLQPCTTQILGDHLPEGTVARHYPRPEVKAAGRLGQVLLVVVHQPLDQLVGHRLMQLQRQVTAVAVVGVDDGRRGEFLDACLNGLVDTPGDDRQIRTQQRSAHHDREVGFVVVGQREHRVAQSVP